jgi:hypothetical protein
LQAAADAALNGDTILIRDGRYPGQNLSGAKTLTFRGAGPGRPRFGTTYVDANNVTIAHVLIENGVSDDPEPLLCDRRYTVVLGSCGADQTFDDVVVDGMSLPYDPSEFVRKIGLSVTGRDVTFKNGEIRGINDSKGFQGGGPGMVIEGTDFRDIRLTPGGERSGVHNECAYVTGGDRQLWRANRFLECPIQGLFFANCEGCGGFRATVENNLFTHVVNPDGSWHEGPPFYIPSGGGRNDMRGWLVRNNTFETPPQFDATPTTADDNGSAQFYGNLAAISGVGIPSGRSPTTSGPSAQAPDRSPSPTPTTAKRRPIRRRSTSMRPSSTFTCGPARRRPTPQARRLPGARPRRRGRGDPPDAGAYELRG